MKLALHSGIVALVVAAAALGGCASPADKQAMTVSKTAAGGKQQPYTVAVTATGGAETSAVSSSNIGNADLKAAIESSIKETHAFRDVVQGKDGQYELLVNVVSLSKPSFGLSFTVDLECGWTLTRVSDQKIMLRKSIASTSTASMGDAFAGVTRLRLAVEGAARANIAQGLTAIGQLDL
jgi:hypothetical protein